MALAAKTASTFSASTIETAAIELTQTDTALSIAAPTLEQIIKFLGALGLPALPVAPAQDPYLEGQHKIDNGNRKTSWSHCPLTLDFKPEPQFTGKNPSYLDREGKPHLIKHGQYKKRLPTDEEIQLWWENPLNGIGTLGGINGIYWPDFDVKNFESQEECDRAFNGIVDAHPALKATWQEQTHSGGYRLGVRLKQKPDFTNFALEPGGKHRGEVLGEGRFTVLAPTIGVSGNPYVCLQLASPVESDSIESIGMFSVKSKSAPATPRPQHTAAPIASVGTIALEQLGYDNATAALRGENIKGDCSETLTMAYREWSGWANWTADNGIGISGSAADLAHQAGEALGIDADRVDRILKGIDSISCLPAAQYKGGDESCWKKIRKLDRAMFDVAAPPAIRDALESLYAKPDRGNHTTSDGGEGNGGNGGSGDGGDGGDDAESFNSGNDWNTPVSRRGEIGVWIKPKGSDEHIFDPRCNFDFQIIRELHSEDGGGIEITIKRSFDRHENIIFIQSVDYTSTEKFTDALKKALGTGVVCNLNKYELNALMHSRLKAYHQRDTQTYRLIERRGRQRDGTWVFKDKQFKADGTLTTTEESGWVYIKHFPNSDDFIPEPTIDDYDPEALPRYVRAKQKTFGANFPQSMLLDGFMAASLYDSDILEAESSFPIVSLHGDGGSMKSYIAECSLGLVGYKNAEDGIVSDISESMLFERLKYSGSIPILWDDPNREKENSVNEIFKKAYNRYPRQVRGNRQTPGAGVACTANWAVGEKHAPTRSRLISLYLSLLATGNDGDLQELKRARREVNRCFPDLLKLGYPHDTIKALETELSRHLPTAHPRTPRNLAIIVHYAMEIIKLSGVEFDIKDWVVKILAPQLNESHSGLDSVTDFIERLETLKAQSLVGEWNLIEVESREHGECVALHLPGIWSGLERESKPTYNKSVLEKELIQRGAFKGVARFWEERDLTLAYKRRLVVGGSGGENADKPREPGKRVMKCLLVKKELWQQFTDPYAADEAVAKKVTAEVTEVTASNLNPVTFSNLGTASISPQLGGESNQVTSNRNEFVFVSEEGVVADSMGEAAIAMTVNAEPAETQIEVTRLLSAEEVTETRSGIEVEEVTDPRLLPVTQAQSQVTLSPEASELLSAEQVSAVLQVMSKIQSVVSFDEFASKYKLFFEAQQQQIWEAATPELRRKYDHWQANFLAVPDVVWNAHHALMHTYSVPELKAVREQFEPEILRAASKLLNKSVKAQIKGLFEALEKGL